MSVTRTPTRLALALLAATCLTPVAAAQAAPGDPVGPEFLVNTYATGDQMRPETAMDSDGDFVVVWQSFGQDGDRSGIFAQRFDAAGVASGPEFRVNTTTADVQSSPTVAMDPDGDFVVAWVRCYYGINYGIGDWGTPFCSGDDVFAQRYNAAGEPQGTEFQVNTTTAHDHPNPTVAMDADGDFVIAWAGDDPDGVGIVAQRFDAAGERVGPEFQVNSTTAGFDPAVAANSDGAFVIAWINDGVVAQRYNPFGEPQGGKLQVTTEASSYPAVAMDSDGDFVVTWQEYRQTDGRWKGQVFAQRYSAGGETQGDAFRVNAITEDDHLWPSIAMDADGDFVVVWAWRHSNFVGGVFAQLFNAAGKPQGGEFLLSGYGNTSVAMDPDGDFVVAWPSFTQDDYSDIFYSDISAQRFQGGERVVGDFDGNGKADLLWRNTATGNTVAWLLDGQTRLEAGSIGAVPDTWRIAGTGDVDGDGMADILWRNTASGNTVVWRMNGLEKMAAQSIGAPSPAWTVRQIRDFDGDGKADILWRHEVTGATAIWLMDGLTMRDAGGIGQPSLDWWIAGTGDFNGDGKADILWRNTVTGKTVIWLMDGTTRLAAGPVGAPGTAWRIAGIGDFNGDGKADILLRHTEDGRVVMWQMNGLEIADYRVLAAVSLAWTVKQVRDTDGDGLSDIVWRHGANGTIVVWRMDGFTKVSATMIGSAGSDWQLR